MLTDLLDLIGSIITYNRDLVLIAIRQRAKFEGWLKFELARQLKMDYYDTVVEYHLSNGQFVDLFSNGSLIELKTPNTNYKAPNVENKTRPITNNIDGIISDIKKLRALNNPGYIAFVMFPVDEEKCDMHIKRVEDELHKDLIQKKFVKIKDGNNYIKVLIFVARVK